MALRYVYNPFTDEFDSILDEDLFLKLDQTTPQTVTNGAPLFNVGLKSPYIYPSADSTTAFQIRKADGTTAVMTVDTTNERIGIGNAAPTEKLEVTGNLYFASENTGVIVDTSGSKRTGFMKYSGFAGAFVHGNTVPLQIGMVNQTAVTGGTFTPQMSIETNGNVSIGDFTATAVLDVNGSANAGSASLRLRGGDGGTAPADAYQILLSYTGAATYTHNIRTRHSGGTPNDNAIDFYTWNQGVDTTTTIGTKHVMSLTGAGRVGIGTTNPSTVLELGGASLAQNGGFKVLASTGSEWFSVGTVASGVVSFASQGGYTLAGDAALVGRFNIKAVNDTYPVLSLQAPAGFTKDFLRVDPSGATTGTYFVIKSDGKVGIGTTAPSAKLHVLDTKTALTANIWATQSFLDWTPSANEETYSGSAQQAGTYKHGTYNVTTSVRGSRVFFENDGSGTITDAVCQQVYMSQQGTGTITNAKGFEVMAPAGTSATKVMTNVYGVYINTITRTGITNPWGIYQAGTSDLNYFAGAVGIGTTSPGAAPFSAKLAVVGPITSIQDVDWNGIYVGADTTRYAAYAWRNVSNRVEFYTRGYAYPIYLNNALWINQNSGGTDGKIGINTQSPSAKLHIIDTTEQLRVGYDASNYYSTTVASNGAVTFNAVGTGASFNFSDDIVLDSTKYFYIGSATVDGSWRIGIGGDNLIIQKRESGNWVTKTEVTP
jgi:hypothetical protein